LNATSGHPAGAGTASTDGQTVPADLAAIAATAADAKASDPTTVLEMTELLVVVDRFVIASGRNVRQVRAIVEDVEQEVRAALGISPIQVEGLREASWVLLDYGDVVVHVFLEEVRAYYDLEHLWSSAPRTAGAALQTRRSP